MRKKRRISFCVILLLVLCMSLNSYAAVNEEELAQAAPASFYTNVGQTAIDECSAMEIQTNNVLGWPQGGQTPTYSAIVMDIDTGIVLYGKNIYDQHYPASITKVMTSLVAVTNGHAEDPVIFSHDAIYNVEAGSASCGMMEGEVITLDTALRCMMSQSANEVAYAIAENVGGTYDNFIQMMNDQAASLGCVNSHFANPHGLFDETHYICAYDMALIASAAYKNDWFRDFCNLQTYTRPITEQNPTNAWVIYNRHKMLHPDSGYYYEGVTGGKTGFTDEARTTLVTFAERDGMRLVSVVLRGEGAVVYDATRTVLDYGFGNFGHIFISDIVDKTQIETVTENALVTVPIGTDPTALGVNLEFTEKDQGIITYTYNDYEVGKSEVTFTKDYLNSLEEEASDDTEKKETVAQSQTEESDAEGILLFGHEISPILLVLCGIFLLALIMLIVFGILLIKLKKSRLSRRKSRAHPPTQRSSQLPSTSQDPENAQDSSFPPDLETMQDSSIPPDSETTTK